MAQKGSDTGRSYAGLISLLIVVAVFIALLAVSGVEPLKGDGHGKDKDGHGHSTDETHGDAHGSNESGDQGGSGHENPSGDHSLNDYPVPQLPGADTVLTRFAFGSCLGQIEPAPILKEIAALKPQFFVWLGDNVYADTMGEDGERVHGPEMIAAAYQTLFEMPAFHELRSVSPFLATWDDHDFGLNDAGAELEYKDRSKKLFLSNMATNANPIVKTRPGVYDAFAFGPAGQRVQVILLDTRTFRSPLKPTDEPDVPGKERYVPDDDPEKTLLGKAQWEWLDWQLRAPADIRFIVSSIQIIADGHGFERWGNFPLERQKLYELIKSTNAQNVIFISGDRHSGALYSNRDAVGYPLVEITSSSLNLPASGFGRTEPRPETDGFKLDDMFIHENFGVAEIDWAAKAVFLELRGLDGELVQSVAVRLEG